MKPPTETELRTLWQANGYDWLFKNAQKLLNHGAELEVLTDGVREAIGNGPYDADDWLVGLLDCLDRGIKFNLSAEELSKWLDDCARDWEIYREYPSSIHLLLAYGANPADILHKRLDAWLIRENLGELLDHGALIDDILEAWGADTVEENLDEYECYTRQQKYGALALSTPCWKITRSEDLAAHINIFLEHGVDVTKLTEYLIPPDREYVMKTIDEFEPAG